MGADRAETADVARGTTYALVVALALPLLALLALFVREVGHRPWLSAIGLFALLAATAQVGFFVLTRRRLPRAGVVAACYGLAWAPLVAMATWHALSLPLAPGVEAADGSGLGETAVKVLALPVLVLAQLVIGLLLGRRLSRRRSNRAIGIAAVAAVTTAFFGALISMVSLGRPDADSYLATLVVTGEGTANTTFAGLRYEMITLPDWPGQAEPPAQAEPPVQASPPAQANPPPLPVEPSDNEDDAADDEGIEPEVVPAPMPPTECRVLGLADVTLIETTYTSPPQCPAVRVRADRRGDVAVVETRAAWEAPGAEWTRFLAFDPRNGRRIGLSQLTVASRTAPPLGWTASAASAGFVGALLVMLGARLARRRATEGIDAYHRGAGRVELASGETFLVASASALPVGAVALLEPLAHAASYRHTGSPSFGAAVAKTMAELRADAGDAVASLRMIALTTAVLGSAPLVITLIARLLAR